jgi:plastocyanin
VTTPMTPAGATPVAEERVGRRRPFATMGLLGLVLLLATTLVFAAVILSMFPEELGFVLLPLAVVGVVTLLAWRIDATWVRVLGILATLAFATMFFWVAFGLGHPASVLDFVPAVTFVLGTLLSLVGNIGAIVQRRAPRAMGSGERRTLQATAAVLGLAVVVSGTMALLGRTTVDPQLASDATVVEMRDFAFEPLTMEVDGGGQLLVANRDAFVHDLTVPDLDLEVTVNPRSEVLVDVPAAPGTYVVYCTLHSDTNDPAPELDGDMMVGQLLVR